MAMRPDELARVGMSMRLNGIVAGGLPRALMGASNDN